MKASSNLLWGSGGGSMDNPYTSMSWDPQHGSGLVIPALGASISSTNQQALAHSGLSQIRWNVLEKVTR